MTHAWPTRGKHSWGSMVGGCCRPGVQIKKRLNLRFSVQGDKNTLFSLRCLFHIAVYF